MKARERIVKTVTVLPARVELTKVGMKGAEGMQGESDTISIKIRNSVAKALQAKGLKLGEAKITEATLRDDAELRTEVGNVQKLYDKVSPQIHRRPKDIRNGRFTLGDEVAAFALASGSDAIVFIRAVGEKQTKTKAYLSGGLTGMMQWGTTMQSFVTLVDARTGEVLYMSARPLTVDAGRPETIFDKALAGMFKQLPVE